MRFATVCAALASSPALAQTGTLRYSPNLNPVPVGSTAIYIVLAVLLAVIGLYVVRREQRNAHRLSGLGAGVLLAALATAQFWVAGEVYARVNNGATLFMSSPTGGILTIAEGTATITNNSGVDLAVAKLNPPCPVSNVASNACTQALIVPNGSSCNIDYTCPNGSGGGNG